MAFDKESKQILNAARTLGNGGISIYLEDHELVRLCMVIAADLGLTAAVHDELVSGVSAGYYGLPLAWFGESVSSRTTLEGIFTTLDSAVLDFRTYFKGICELHKRRIKFSRILESQPMPRMEQIVPRCLLEYGMKPNEALASWLVWRKWLYDVDNRSAQETGYLFEPILAAALGGVPYSAKKSPIRRSDDPSRGRQVDCIDDKTAYEFKMRVTIAASGQGRFSEEIEFAADCEESGYKPVLLVLDPTPSTRLEALVQAFEDHGGSAYIGDEAWDHIKSKAGRTMAEFVTRYVKQPIREVSSSFTDLKPITIKNDATSILLCIGDIELRISRKECGLIDETSDQQA
jgi:hypothetical protein